MRRYLLSIAAGVLLAIATTLIVPAVRALAQQPVIEVRIEPADLTVDVGQEVQLQISVTNHSSVATAPLALHLDITDPRQAKSVDPEDWTPTLTRSIGILDPGATHSVAWPITPISSGRFIAYAVVVPAEGEQTITVSNVAAVAVEERRALNPQGVLPIALGAPLLIGALLAGQRTRRARRR